jgi:hypothetical protein
MEDKGWQERVEDDANIHEESSRGQADLLMEDKGWQERVEGDANIPEESSRGQADLLMEDKGWKEKVETDAHKVSVSQNLEIKFPLKGKKKMN